MSARMLLSVRLMMLVGAMLGNFVTAQATTVVPPEFTELVNGSDYVVRAKVLSLTYETRVQEGQTLIFTRIEFETIEVIAGAPPSPLVLTMLGGKFGDTEMTVAGAPQFRVGEEDILFVEGNGRNFHPLYAVMHGRYPVQREPDTNREYITRSNGVPLADVAEVVLPMAEGPMAAMLRQRQSPATALTPEEFVTQIKQTRAGESTSNAK
ncbi:MAG: hypothetical protein Q8M02_03475 [Candidatus Didemnitutus sp.]|nr:hypothetical protein [Candidatus Didemnitutus sp.]